MATLSFDILKANYNTIVRHVMKKNVTVTFEYSSITAVTVAGLPDRNIHREHVKIPSNYPTTGLPRRCNN